MGFFDDEDENPFLDESDDALAKIIASTDVDADTRDLAFDIEDKREELLNAGIDPGPVEPRHSLFWDIIDTLDAPRQGIAGIADTMLRGDMFQNGVGTGFRRGQKENTTASDIFRRHDIIDNPIARGVTGFAVDVLTDPLTWMTFGTGSGAKVAGKSLTKAGEELSAKTLKHLTDDFLKQGLDPVEAAFEAGIKHPEKFRAMQRLQEAHKVMQGADETGDVFNASQKVFSDSAVELHGLFQPDTILNTEIFKKPALNLGINLPFLGHITGGTNKASELVKDPGPVSQAFRALGKIVKPGRVPLGKIELSDEMMSSLKNINDYGQEKLGKIAETVANTITATPLVGKSIGRAGAAAKEIVAKAGEQFQKIFNEAAFYGKSYALAKEELLNTKSQITSIADKRVLDLLGEEGLKDVDTAKDAMSLIDGAQAAVLARVGENKEILDIVNRGKVRGELGPAEGRLIREKLDKVAPQLDEQYRQEFQRILSDPNLNPKTRDLAIKLSDDMERLRAEELAAGIDYGHVEHYMMHRYVNSSRHTGGASTLNPFKNRKYNTLADAWEQSKYIGDTDLPRLLRDRYKFSLEQQANKRFFERLVKEYSLPASTVTALYKEALSDPGGAASQFLKSKHFDIPPGMDKDLALGAEAFAKRTEGYARAGTGQAPLPAIFQKPMSEFANHTKEQLMAAGVFPRNNHMPNSLLAEMGESVKIPGGKEEFFLPKPIADAYKEIAVGKDLLKSKFGDGEFGRAAINLMDHANGFYKKFVTLPWMAYWTQNLFTVPYRVLSHELHDMDPGLMARTHDFLAGKSAITSVNGSTMTLPLFNRVQKALGLAGYNTDEFIGTMKAGGDMNVNALARSKNYSFGQNFVSRADGAKIATLRQAQDAMDKGTDGFFRVMHFMHRFEKGDSIPDAVKAANDFLFNYRNLSPVEQSYFRRFYMFYGFMSKATKAAVTDLITQPGAITNQVAAVRNLAEMFSQPDAAPTADMVDLNLLNSSVMSDQLSFPVGKTPEGKTIIGRGFAAPLNAVMQQFSAQAPRNFSVGEMLDAASDSVGRTIQKQFATANPAIKAAAEKITGKNLYFDKPLTAEFLNKLPSFNEAAKKYAGWPHDGLPMDLDAPIKTFLKALPDGKGRLVADPGRFWFLMNAIPGLSRLTSTAGHFTNADIPTKTALLKAMMNINLQDTDPSRTYLYDTKANLEEMAEENFLRRRKKNLEEGIE